LIPSLEPTGDLVRDCASPRRAMLLVVRISAGTSTSPSEVTASVAARLYRHIGEGADPSVWLMRRTRNGRDRLSSPNAPANHHLRDTVPRSASTRLTGRTCSSRKPPLPATRRPRSSAVDPTQRRASREAGPYTSCAARATKPMQPCLRSEAGTAAASWGSSGDDKRTRDTPRRNRRGRLRHRRRINLARQRLGRQGHQLGSGTSGRRTRGALPKSRPHRRRLAWPARPPRTREHQRTGCTSGPLLRPRRAPSLPPQTNPRSTAESPLRRGLDRIGILASGERDD
jgi:hypothetical protein